jgi:heme/copper-type cytochrome/quinol oxidase subunit 3
MIRPVLTEIAIFLIPFAAYAVFLMATRAGVLDPASWPLPVVAKLTFGALLLVVLSLVLLAQYSGAPPNSTYVPARIENGVFIPGREIPGDAK